MSETEASPQQNRRAPLDIWREVRRVLCTLFDIFGDPREVASRHTLTLKEHQRCTTWLRGVEALFRRMLFIEAALIANELPTPPPARGRLGGGPAPHAAPDPLPIAAQSSSPLQGEACQRVMHDPEHPEAWRVSFRCLYGPPASRRPALDSAGSAQAGGTPAVHIAPKFRSAWPLAERMEALLRVFNDPAPCAKRLARRLRARSALVERICVSWDEFRDLVGRTLFDALIKPTDCASRVFSSA
jgi:hypothetical protein